MDQHWKLLACKRRLILLRRRRLRGQLARISSRICKPSRIFRLLKTSRSARQPSSRQAPWVAMDFRPRRLLPSMRTLLRNLLSSWAHRVREFSCWPSWLLKTSLKTRFGTKLVRNKRKKITYLLKKSLSSYFSDCIIISFVNGFSSIDIYPCPNRAHCHILNWYRGVNSSNEKDCTRKKVS